MVEMLSRLIRRMDSSAFEATDVIPWSCPVPAFGDLSTSFVATLGLNPSNREFVDKAGNELEGASRLSPYPEITGAYAMVRCRRRSN